ncbi:MAG: hypothetical protein IKM44_04515 [Clostridia bacterium]|nr:hypothetical protein [Clostridia bacterium]
MKKTQHKIISTALALLLTFVLLLTALCGCRLYSRKTFDYNEIVYTRPNVNNIKTALQRAAAEAKSNDLYSVNKAVNSAMTALNDFVGDYYYVNIEYNKDKRAYADEFSWMTTAYNELMNEYYAMMYAYLQSDFADALFAGWSEADIAYIESRNQSASPEYTALVNEISALQQEYALLEYSEMTAEYVYAVEDIIVALAKKLNAQAIMDGYDSYKEKAYALKYGRAYTPQQAKSLRNSVKTHIAPIINDLYDYETLRAQADLIATQREQGRSGYSSAGGSTRAVNYDDSHIRYALDNGIIKALANEVSPFAGEAYDYLMECNLYNLSDPVAYPNRSGSSFAAFLPKQQAPYMIVNCDGSPLDISTFVHEFGHYTSFYKHGSQGGSDLDVAEIHSQGLEALFADYWRRMYLPDVADAIIEDWLFTTAFNAITLGCLFDEFLDEIFTNPSAYAQDGQVTALFDRKLEEYNADEYFDILSDINGMDYSYWWASVSHNIDSPFYYISYAMSAIPALTIYEDSATDRAVAIREYNVVVAYGDGAYTFEEVLQIAGIASPFNDSTIRTLAQFLKNQ